jgi:hypothetical protein
MSPGASIRNFPWAVRGSVADLGLYLTSNRRRAFVFVEGKLALFGDSFINPGIAAAPARPAARRRRALASREHAERFEPVGRGEWGVATYITLPVLRPARGISEDGPLHRFANACTKLIDVSIIQPQPQSLRTALKRRANHLHGDPTSCMKHECVRLVGSPLCL